MSGPESSPPQAAAGPHGSGGEQMPARADLHDAVGWIVLGTAILIGSITMDRLERQNINPYTVPGLLPGLLGIAMILLGAVLGLRSLRRGALDKALPPPGGAQREQRRRIGIVAALCTVYAVVLVGQGLPFWLASAVYVGGSILLLQGLSREPRDRRLGVRSWLAAIAIGLGTGVITQLVFQELFLVRLP